MKKIVSSSGATIKNIEPRILRQTISQSTSDKIVQYCNKVVAGEEGTGKTARPAGYMIGGKTGTAQTLPRGNHQYVVSFMGYAPADDPQIAIYVVVDRPNVTYQADAKYATRIVRAILTEALPYLNFPMTEELSEKEQAELAELREQLVTTYVSENVEEETAENTEEETEAATESSSEEVEEKDRSSIWESFSKDPSTGYLVDPNSGNVVDPDSGAVLGGDDLPDFNEAPNAASSASSN